MKNLALRTSALAAAVGLALCLPSVAGAMVVPLTLQQLVDSSTAIVRVRVVNESARAVGDGARGIPMDSIVTDSQLTVLDSYKGSTASRFTLTQPGGTADGYRLDVSDVPNLATGEEAVLFLDDRGVVGGEQGALPVAEGMIPALGISLSELESDISKARGGVLATSGDPAAAREAASAGDATTLSSGSYSAEGVSAAAVPSIGSVVPAFGANGGVGETITLAGSGFGAAAGHVYFLRGTVAIDESAIPSWNHPAYMVEAAVRSWSDSSVTVVVPGEAQSGTVAVYAADGSLKTFRYSMGFSYLGHRWADKGVSYFINENTPDMTGEASAIRRAMSTWNTCGADFVMAYAGSSNIANMLPQPDGKNDIFFVASDVSGTAFSHYLAVNELWSKVSNGTDTGEFLESNLMIFDYEWKWGDGTNGTIDLESVALHELGHAVGLGDQYLSTDRVMGAYDGNRRRSLTSYEIDGAVYLYGSSRLTLGSSSKLSPAYGKPAYVSVRLRDNYGQPITGQTVTLNLNGTPAATLTGSVSDPGLYYGYAPVVKSKTLFWAYWAGDGTNSAGAALVTVKPKVKLSANAPESNRRYRKFTVKGSIAPAHSKAKIRFEVWKRRSSGSYYRYKTYSVTSSKGSFSKSMSLPKGSYRVRTTHSDGGHASSASSYDYFKVR